MKENGLDLRAVKSFPSLVKYLRDELDWPIESDDVEELTFDYEPEELGLDAKTAVKIKEIKQLRPLASNQPWGIFFINFEPKQLPIVALRRILRALVFKKRVSGSRAQQKTWQLNDLLFISSYGTSSERAITLAHFSEDSRFGDLPTLRVLGWDAQDTVLHLEDAEQKLKTKLRWPEAEDDVASWRATWSSAFTLRPREVVRTSKELAIKLADLATVIRERANKVLAIESTSGPFRKLHEAFREALIHDLSQDDFADMYAQTIAYGLLTAHVSRPAGLVAENIVDIVPNTNPFLKELLGTFLRVGGRKGKIDFDELGINEVVELLRNADMDAVLRDFGDRNPNEDPVIHFYELFLKEYDPVKRMKRGVFYTPRPVVSFIVRSVDEILRTEFGLEDGLADVTTWSEMAERHQGLEIPQGVSAHAPFVQILDPATGTGTFLVEVIDVIHKTMVEKWRKQGTAVYEIQHRWDDYVQRDLLPRLYGFELMMAPYAIAHMKIGLKLRETGYSFFSSERARVYLTNTLEEPKDFSDYFEQMAPALAHEAYAANKVKRSYGTTVIIGNPPYSGHSANTGQWINDLLRGKDTLTGGKTGNYFEIDGKPLGERNPKWLNDDYVKFIRYGQRRIELAGIGVLSYISNHSYLDNPTFRGMRKSLIDGFTRIHVIDLHGSSKKREAAPDGSKDENVFDIQQGVAVSIMVRDSAVQELIEHSHLYGYRDLKYKAMIGGQLPAATIVLPKPSYYLFTPQDLNLRDEYEQGRVLTEICPVSTVGVVTGQDAKTIGMTLAEAQQLARAHDVPAEKVRPILYRPFDKRFIVYDSRVVTRQRAEVMKHMEGGNNLGLVSARSNKSQRQDQFFCSHSLIETKCGESTTQSAVFPLYLYDSPKGGLLRSQAPKRVSRHVNVSEQFVGDLASRIDFTFVRDGRGDLNKTFGPEDVFHYLYAVFHSPTYRTRYAEFLKLDFPRVPVTHDSELFRKLCALGADLAALHLLEDDHQAASWNTSTARRPIQSPITHFVGSGTAEIAKGYPKYQDGSVFINSSRRFSSVPEEAWNFHIGGYQVCEKWLKDRRGRTLSDEDIVHYKRIVVALNETIRLMGEIDAVIEEHGGWPLPGSQDAPQPSAPDQLPFS